MCFRSPAENLICGLNRVPFLGLRFPDEEHVVPVRAGGAGGGVQAHSGGVAPIGQDEGFDYPRSVQAEKVLGQHRSGFSEISAGASSQHHYHRCAPFRLDNPAGALSQTREETADC